MKRLRPEQRQWIVHKTFLNHSKQWTCMYGQWNRDKLLKELATTIKRGLKDEE